MIFHYRTYNLIVELGISSKHRLSFSRRWDWSKNSSSKNQNRILFPTSDGLSSPKFSSIFLNSIIWKIFTFSKITKPPFWENARLPIPFIQWLRPKLLNQRMSGIAKTKLCSIQHTKGIFKIASQWNNTYKSDVKRNWSKRNSTN